MPCGHEHRISWCCAQRSTFLRFRQRLTHPKIAERTSNPTAAGSNLAGGDGRQRAMHIASLGIAAFPRDAQEPETLLQRADIALYEAKECGGNAYRLFASLAQDSEAAIDGRGTDEQRPAG